MEKKPNLFIVGVPRAGTTSLYNYLKEHPEVFMSHIKGPNYFGEKKSKNFPEYHKNKKKYLKLFDNVKREKVIGEASHLFSSKIAPKQIRKFNPDSKIIISLRNPIEVFKSRYFLGKLKRDSILEIIKNRNKTNKFLWDNLKYEENLRRYFKEFKRENIYIIIFENFVKNTKKEWEKICKYLGIKKSFYPDFKQHNATRDLKNKWVLRIILKILPGKLRIYLKNRFPKLRESAKNKIYKITTKKNKDKTITPKEKEELIKVFHKEIENTQKLIKKNLKNIWK